MAKCDIFALMLSIRLAVGAWMFIAAWFLRDACGFHCLLRCNYGC